MFRTERPGRRLAKVVNVDHAASGAGRAGPGGRYQRQEREAALAAADAVEALMEKVGQPVRLRDFGVPEADLGRCSLHAIADSNIIFNARPVSDPMQVYAVYQQAY
jgi:alcohol dehydrogenase class IV